VDVGVDGTRPTTQLGCTFRRRSVCVSPCGRARKDGEMPRRTPRRREPSGLPRGARIALASERPRERPAAPSRCRFATPANVLCTSRRLSASSAMHFTATSCCLRCLPRAVAAQPAPRLPQHPSRRRNTNMRKTCPVRSSSDAWRVIGSSHVLAGCRTAYRATYRDACRAACAAAYRAAYRAGQPSHLLIVPGERPGERRPAEPDISLFNRAIPVSPPQSLSGECRSTGVVL
jgi:hypothetical protein